MQRPHHSLLSFFSDIHHPLCTFFIISLACVFYPLAVINYCKAVRNIIISIAGVAIASTRIQFVIIKAHESA